MLKKIPHFISFLICELISAFFITFSVIPGFSQIGHLDLQIIYTVIIVIAFLFIADEKKFTPVTLSHSIVIMTAFWLFKAFFNQYRLHAERGDNGFYWIYDFYYDKPALIFLVFVLVAVFYAFKFTGRYNDREFFRQYKKFQKITFSAFIVYYLLLLVYCFFLVRGKGEMNTENINLVPFTIIRILKETNFDYEYSMFFLGNIAMFMPMGVIVSALFKKKCRALQFAIPFIISIGIEVSQLLLGNGHPDIDDVILNVTGYYLGFAAKLLLDKFVFLASKGKCTSVFVL